MPAVPPGVPLSWEAPACAAHAQTKFWDEDTSFSTDETHGSTVVLHAAAADRPGHQANKCNAGEEGALRSTVTDLREEFMAGLGPGDPGSEPQLWGKSTGRDELDEAVLKTSLQVRPQPEGSFQGSERAQQLPVQQQENDAHSPQTGKYLLGADSPFCSRQENKDEGKHEQARITGVAATDCRTEHPRVQTEGRQDTSAVVDPAAARKRRRSKGPDDIAMSAVTATAAGVPTAPALACTAPKMLATPVRPIATPARRGLGLRGQNGAAVGDEHGVAVSECTSAEKPRRRNPQILERCNDGASADSSRKSVAAAEECTLEAAGHTLRPSVLGRRVVVVGDGWGAGGPGGYEAVVTEADHKTYTVIAVSGAKAWMETHVLQEHCVLVSSTEHVKDETGNGTTKSQRLKAAKARRLPARRCI